MDNYKIKVKDEAESKEAQELFFELGYRWNHNGKTYFKVSSGEILAYSRGVLFQCGDDTGSEITLPQLRDLVVLKRNDINDANCIDKKREAWYLASDGTYYAWQYRKLCWDTESDACVEAHDIKPIKKHLETATGRFDENGEHHLTFSNGTEEKDPALISGAEALRALADGKSVEWQDDNGVWWPLGAGWSWNSIVNSLDGIKALRLKPQTIKLELELPKPFEPKEGDEYFYISTLQHCLYSHDVWSDEPADITQAAFGAYRTEDEIKQVVEQLRKIRGAS